jgi:hypothetical protein
MTRMEGRRLISQSLRGLPENRAGEIRTRDLLNPIQAHYQAVLRPEIFEEPERNGLRKKGKRFFLPTALEPDRSVFPRPRAGSPVYWNLIVLVFEALLLNALTGFRMSLQKRFPLGGSHLFPFLLPRAMSGADCGRRGGAE